MIGGEELSLKKARFALAQAQSKGRVLVDDTKRKRTKTLKDDFDQASSNATAKYEAWKLEKLKNRQSRDRSPSGERFS
jgi:hypothetical protein